MKIKQALSLMAVLGALTSQLSAAAGADHPLNKIRRHHTSGCSRCANGPIDIRQGPGFWNQNQNQQFDYPNPYTDEIYDDEPRFENDFY